MPGPAVRSFSPPAAAWTPPPAPGGPARPRAEPRLLYLPHVLGGGLAALFTLLALLVGHGFLNRDFPDVGRARTMFLVAVVLGLAAAAGAYALHLRAERRLGATFWILSGLGAAAAGLLLHGALYDSYGDEGGFFAFLVTMLLVLATVLVAGVAGLLVGLHKGRVGGRMALGWGLALSVGGAGTALAFLATLREQAAVAAAVNQAEPGFGLVLAAAALGAAALARRRSRRRP